MNDASRRQYFDAGSTEKLESYADDFRQICERILNGEDTGEEELRALPARMAKDPEVDSARIRDTLWNAGAEVRIRYGLGGVALPDSRDHADLPDGCEALIDQLLKSMKRAGRARKNRYVDDAKTYIQEHFSDSMLSLDAVSDALGISKYYLSSLFTQMTDTGFSDYVRMVRVEKAKELLEHTDSTAVQIGFKVGFASTQSFYAVFKKYAGETPRAFRQRVKDN